MWMNLAGMRSVLYPGGFGQSVGISSSEEMLAVFLKRSL
ncbi:Uncharacterised protein [Mycobacterium tuberculosis]|nr:Uncharacterised protein [Mycobacterium tuberculosis]